LRERSEEKKGVRNNPTDTNVSEEREGRRCCRHQSRDLPTAVENITVRQIVPLQPMERTVMKHIVPASCGKDPCWSSS